MSSLLLVYSHCKDCGACCFNCDHLNKETGCSDDSFRLSSRCASFPVIYGDPNRMGYTLNFDNLLDLDEKSGERWFIIDLYECLLLQHELIFHSLRWMIEEINLRHDIRSIFVSFGEYQLQIYLVE